MNQDDLQAQFDAWAQTYDEEVQTSGFPFEGYALTLRLVFAQADVRPGMRVLDLGVGTGNLARPFVEAGCEVVGVDFSEEMLARTNAKLPTLQTIQADLTRTEPLFTQECRFERIVSNYVFHEFVLERKLALLDDLAQRNLCEGGRIVIGDVMFAEAAERDHVREIYAAQWDDEFYWLVDETQVMLEGAGWEVVYSPTSFCTGVLLLTPPVL